MAAKPPRDPRRNPVLVALIKRYGRATTTHRDRRRERGGARNRVRDYLKDRD